MIACDSCGRNAAIGRARLTFIRADSDAMPDEQREHAGKSATRALCRRCRRDRCALPFLAVEWIETFGPDPELANNDPKEDRE